MKAAMRIPFIRVGADTYTVSLLLVTERDHLGRPLAARFVHDEQTLDLAELTNDGTTKPEFITAFCNRETWGAPTPEEGGS